MKVGVGGLNPSLLTLDPKKEHCSLICHAIGMKAHNSSNRRETHMWGTIEYLGLALIPGFIVLDFVTRARNFETPKLWRLRALVVTVLTFALSMVVTIFWGTLL